MDQHIRDLYKLDSMGNQYQLYIQLKHFIIVTISVNKVAQLFNSYFQSMQPGHYQNILPCKYKQHGAIGHDIRKLYHIQQSFLNKDFDNVD